MKHPGIVSICLRFREEDMAHSAQRVEISPYFDLELFMSVSGEKRLGGAVAERLTLLWEKWMPELNARRIGADSAEYLAVWLNPRVEEEVDAAWAESPSDAYLYNALAQVMCMSAARGLVPEIEGAGCAPAPRPTKGLRAALRAEGLPYSESDTLSRRYALLTHYPFKGGCEVCAMRKDCPRAGGAGENASVLLPGFEKGEGSL
jgi:hypothetical protein